MNDETLKFVAKIQHFYDIMAKTNIEINDEIFLETGSIKNIVSEKLHKLVCEYHKVFDDFLYKDSD